MTSGRMCQQVSLQKTNYTSHTECQSLRIDTSLHKGIFEALRFYRSPNDKRKFKRNEERPRTPSHHKNGLQFGRHNVQYCAGHQSADDGPRCDGTFGDVFSYQKTGI